MTPVDSSTFKVVWKAQDGLPLNYLLRVEQGKGPLALLELKNFRLPGQVFLTGRSMKDAEEYGKTPMSELLQKLTRSCFADRDALDVARTQAALWQTWLLPVTADTPVGKTPATTTISCVYATK